MKRSLIYFCAFAFLLIGCGKENSSREDRKEPHLVIASEPYSLDPRNGGYRNSQNILRMLFEGLMRIGADNQLVPGVAEDVSISPDLIVYTFHLRESSWSDGSAVTAHDFEHAWRNIISPASQSSFGYAFYIIKNAKAAKLGQLDLDAVGIKALDDKTLIVTLEHPAPYFLELTANPIYSPVSKAIDQKHPKWGSESSQYVSNGPFKLKNWKHHSQLLVEKNPFYWDAENVLLPAIAISIIEEPHTSLNMFKNGLVDWIGEPLSNLPLDAVPSLVKAGKMNFHPMGGVYWYEFNVKASPFDSPKMRRAFSLAANRKEIVEHLLQGEEQPATSILPPMLLGTWEAQIKDGDQALARTLFAEALSEMKMDISALPPIKITYAIEPTEKVIAEALQRQWSKAFGLPIVLEAVESHALMDKFVQHDFQIAGSGWLSWYHDPIYTLEYVKYSSNGINGTQWEDPEYIALLDASDLDLNAKEREAHLKQAEALLMKEMPIIPLYYSSYKYLKNEKLKDVFLSDLGQIDFKWARYD
jgi:oligopeptide transport system substrate-binding protein